MNRRQFIALGLMATLEATPVLARGNRANVFPRTLILVELKGGNDGLNTVIPYSDNQYYRLRPDMAVPRDQVLVLDDVTGLHPALEPLMRAWRAGDMAIVQGVGYPRPNRSHFSSIEIWDSGTGRTGQADKGWLSWLLPHLPGADAFVADGITFDQRSGPLAGARVLDLRDPRRFLEEAGGLRAERGRATGNPALRHLFEVEQRIESSARALKERVLRIDLPQQARFPRNSFGRELEIAARVVAASVPVPVIKVSLGSFDTHARQSGRHRQLLGQLADGLEALRATLMVTGQWQDVLVMTYSEFGRRVASNASHGTDHGTAAPHFLLGGRVRGGQFSQMPSLNDLDNGDLKFTTDYRSIYATIARDWFAMGQSLLPGSAFKPIPLLKT